MICERSFDKKSGVSLCGKLCWSNDGRGRVTRKIQLAIQRVQI